MATPPIDPHSSDTYELYGSKKKPSLINSVKEALKKTAETTELHAEHITKKASFLKKKTPQTPLPQPMVKKYEPITELYRFFDENGVLPKLRSALQTGDNPELLSNFCELLYSLPENSGQLGDYLNKQIFGTLNFFELALKHGCVDVVKTTLEKTNDQTADCIIKRKDPKQSNALHQMVANPLVSDTQKIQILKAFLEFARLNPELRKNIFLDKNRDGKTYADLVSQTASIEFKTLVEKIRNMPFLSAGF